MNIDFMGWFLVDRAIRSKIVLIKDWCTSLENEHSDRAFRLQGKINSYNSLLIKLDGKLDAGLKKGIETDFTFGEWVYIADAVKSKIMLIKDGLDSLCFGGYGRAEEKTSLEIKMRRYENLTNRVQAELDRASAEGGTK